MTRVSCSSPVAAVYDRRAFSKRVAHTFGGHRPPLQRKLCAHIFLLGFLIIAAPLAHAQATPPAQPAQAPTVPVTSPAMQSYSQGQPAAQEDISDIRPPLFFLHSWWWLWILLAITAIIALVVLVWKGVSRSPYLSPKSAYDLALEKLAKARDLLKEEDPVPYAIFVSETIRSYLSQRFQTPSTRRTTEEFLRLMEADPNTPLSEHSELLRSFLQSCDLVKFARYQPTLAELERVQQGAFSFVHATQPKAAEGKLS